MPGTTDQSADSALPLLAPSAAVLIADDEARFREVNAAALDLLKYSEPELKRMHVWDITAPAQRDTARQMWKAFISEGRQAGIYQVRRSDGRQVTVQYEATANFRPGRHISILQPASRSHPESRPLDECPFDRPFAVDFDRCPAYQPRLAHMADSREQPVGQVWTCDHLAATRMRAQPAYYARCALGDAPSRSRWLGIAQQHGLLAVRALRSDFYRNARSEIRQLIAAQVARRGRPGEPLERLRTANDVLLAALADFIRHRRQDLKAAGIDPATLKRAVEATLHEGLRRGELQGLRPPEGLITTYPPAVQAFLRPDLGADRMLRGSGPS